MPGSPEEKSSGKTKGGLHITKRGPGIARLFLYLAALRLIQRDRIIRAWYAK
jgi:transposase